jgi:glycosyltransferase involved in cell wall biosynthesis
MLSSFDRNAGGRETWLYNFLPELVKDKTIAKILLYGFKTNNDEKNYNDLLSLDGNSQKIFPTIFKLKKTKLPLFISMFFSLKKHKSAKSETETTLAMGIFELIMMLYIKRFKNTKKVVWLRSIFSNEKAYAIPSFLKGILLKYEIRLLRKVDIIISNGDDIKDFYKKYELNVNVIKNGVDIDKWKQEPLKLSNTINIAYIGRLSKVKGIESFFELIKIIKNSNYADDFLFHTVGNESIYKEIVSELVDKKWLINHGLIPNNELPVFLKKIEVCVALTFASNDLGGGGTSNAMLEQMAASKIMLAWDNEIFRQYLNNNNAYLVKQYDVNGLKKALIEIKNNKNNAIKKGVEASKAIIPYTYKANVSKFKTLVFNY